MVPLGLAIEISASQKATTLVTRNARLKRSHPRPAALAAASWAARASDAQDHALTKATFASVDSEILRYESAGWTCSCEGLKGRFRDNDGNVQKSHMEEEEEQAT
jgi:hypothetical protein